MEAEELYRCLEDFSALNGDTLSGLREIIAAYPYFQTARMLYLKNLFLSDKRSFPSELERMAVFVADRRKLFRLIEGDKYGWGVEPESRPAAGEKSADSFSLIDDFLASHGQEQEARGEKELLFQPSVSSDYILWALAEEERGGKEEPCEETPGKKLRHHDLIDSFIENDQRRVPGSRLGQREMAEEPALPEALPDEGHPQSLDDSCLTETLARIYIKQKRYEKALQIIQNLNLKYPEKNIYFADQIRFLEKLIINTKK